MLRTTTVGVHFSRVRMVERRALLFGGESMRRRVVAGCPKMHTKSPVTGPAIPIRMSVTTRTIHMRSDEALSSITSVADSGQVLRVSDSMCRSVRSRNTTIHVRNSDANETDRTQSETPGQSELPHPTALGAARPSLVEGGASCFCVGACIQCGHSGSRLRRRLPFTGGSECPTPTGWTLGHNRRCALLVALEHRWRRGKHRTTPFDRGGSKRGGDGGRNSCGRCIPSLLASLAEEGGLAPSISAKQFKCRSTSDSI